ncbi:MAG: alternate F1F0 ATPase, F1 subunit alpha [Chloroflexi bacterium]|nr:alternate F1F0 ATPase, F1 subunit alpha [Chloroflexota bacterium]
MMRSDDALGSSAGDPAATGAMTPPTDFLDRLGPAVSAVRDARARVGPDLLLRDIGTVVRIGRGIARVEGLPGVGSEELVRFPGGRLGMALDLEPDSLGVVLLDQTGDIDAGDLVRRTGRVMDVPVGDRLMGRVIDPPGRPRDGRPPPGGNERLPIERPAPAIMDRATVQEPLQTGLKVVDALIPIGRGQRELIVGDRQSGKTAIAIDTILNQRGRDVVCVYCAIALRSSSIARTVAELQEHGAMAYTVVVATTGDDPAGLQFIAPYAATSVAERFMEAGRDVLIVYDDLTSHARAYREISLLLRRPPGREAFPGDIFYIHSRLLERATHLNAACGGGSLTALPIVETQAQNIAAYIPTNLISITDGQIYLSSRLFRQGMLPAVDVGLSVSRVGGKAQLPAYRAVAGDLRLAYTQFEELERFSRYGARLGQERRHALERGRRVREILKQPQYEPLGVAEQVAVLVAVTGGLLDDLPVERIALAERALRQAISSRDDLRAKVQSEGAFGEDTRDALIELGRRALDEAGLAGGDDRGDD